MARNFKSKKTKGYRKRSYKKKTTKSKYVAKQPGAFATRQFVKLKYTGSYDHIASTANIVVYRGNGLYDPEGAVGGNQPLGFDQWTSFYNNYRVRASKIKCSYIVDNATSATLPPATQICILPNITGTTYTSILASQQRFAKSKFVPSSCTTTQVLKSYCKTNAIYGVTKSSVADQDNFGSSTSGLPSNQWYWNFTAYSLDGATSTDAWLQVEIVYYVEFYNPVILPAS